MTLVRYAEAASEIGFDLHLGAFVGHFGHERAIEHRELGSSRLDDDGLVGGGDDLALERLRVDVKAQCRAKLSDLSRIEAALSTLVGECHAHQGNVSCPLIAALHC
ncbi:mercuric resistance operon regulatory protein [Methylibium petroleiphilum PM1]|uniref:Mercuric resistance operon regulatory protein n=1 Tax=Methylibium petroleiphilum (strain ATCC BAA-1232 / LMG 22953 / PM1) TaxID=420662 RepID=A2SIB8_METPP|nr:mercuric resistance operon regulatory protein [Methylibium petroleiphilum PM1]